VILISEEELALLRREATEPSLRLEHMIVANKEAERYAGKLEQALERIADACSLALSIEELGSLPYDELRKALHIIEGLVQVKDDRKTVGRYYGSEQG
jgi:hypothetical protein